MDNIDKELAEYLRQLGKNKISKDLPKAKIVEVGFIENEPNYKHLSGWKFHFDCRGDEYITTLLNADLGDLYMGYTYDELEEISKAFWSDVARVWQMPIL